MAPQLQIMGPSSPPPPSPPPRKRGGSTYTDYKLFMADLSQVCDGRTLKPTTKYNEKDPAKGIQACQAATSAIDKLRADIGLASLQDYYRPRRGNRTRRDEPQRRSSSRGKESRRGSGSSFLVRSGDPKNQSTSTAAGRDGAGIDSIAFWRSSSRDKDSRRGSDASLTMTSGDPNGSASSFSAIGDVEAQPTSAAASKDGAGFDSIVFWRGKDSRRGSAASTVSSTEASAQSASPAVPAYRRTSSLPVDGATDSSSRRASSASFSVKSSDPKAQSTSLVAFGAGTVSTPADIPRRSSSRGKDRRSSSDASFSARSGDPNAQSKSLVVFQEKGASSSSESAPAYRRAASLPAATVSDASLTVRSSDQKASTAASRPDSDPTSLAVLQGKDGRLAVPSPQDQAGQQQQQRRHSSSNTRSASRDSTRKSGKSYSEIRKAYNIPASRSESDLVSAPAGEPKAPRRYSSSELAGAPSPSKESASRRTSLPSVRAGPSPSPSSSLTASDGTTDPRPGSDSISTKSGDGSPPAAVREDGADNDAPAAAPGRSGEEDDASITLSDATSVSMASCPGGVSRRHSSCERTVASCPTSNKKTSSQAYRRTSSLPTGSADKPRATLRRKFRPRHHSASLNRRVEGIMKPSKYSASAPDSDANVDAAIAKAVATINGSGCPADAATPSSRRSSMPAMKLPSLRRNSQDGKNFRRNSQDSLSSLEPTEASSGHSSWSNGDDRGGGWVPQGVDFSANMEVYIYERK